MYGSGLNGLGVHQNSWLDQKGVGWEVLGKVGYLAEVQYTT